MTFLAVGSYHSLNIAVNMVGCTCNKIHHKYVLSEIYKYLMTRQPIMHTVKGVFPYLTME